MSTGVGFGRVPPYLQDINRCVEVTMTHKTTLGATELPLVQRHIGGSSASATGLARIPRVDFH